MAFERWSEPARRAIGRAVVAGPDHRLGLADLVTALERGGPSTIHLPGDGSWTDDAHDAFRVAEALAGPDPAAPVTAVCFLAGLADAAFRHPAGVDDATLAALIARVERLAHRPPGEAAAPGALARLCRAFGVDPRRLLGA